MFLPPCGPHPAMSVYGALRKWPKPASGDQRGGVIAIAGDGIDGDDGAVKRTGGGEPLEQERDDVLLAATFRHPFLAENQVLDAWRKRRPDATALGGGGGRGGAARSCRRWPRDRVLA